MLRLDTDSYAFVLHVLHTYTGMHAITLTCVLDRDFDHWIYQGRGLGEGWYVVVVWSVNTTV